MSFFYRRVLIFFILVVLAIPCLYVYEKHILVYEFYVKFPDGSFVCYGPPFAGSHGGPVRVYFKKKRIIYEWSEKQ